MCFIPLCILSHVRDWHNPRVANYPLGQNRVRYFRAKIMRHVAPLQRPWTVQRVAPAIASTVSNLFFLRPYVMPEKIFAGFAVAD